MVDKEKFGKIQQGYSKIKLAENSTKVQQNQGCLEKLNKGI